MKAAYKIMRWAGASRARSFWVAIKPTRKHT